MRITNSIRKKKKTKAAWDPLSLATIFYHGQCIKINHDLFDWYHWNKKHDILTNFVNTSKLVYYKYLKKFYYTRLTQFFYNEKLSKHP